MVAGKLSASRLELEQPLWGFLTESPKIGLGNGDIYIQDKEDRKRLSSRASGKLSSGRDVWGR